MADAPLPAGATPAAWTIREACSWLDPKLSEEQLAALLHVAGVQPVGVRHTGRRGRPEKTWDAAVVMRLHRAVMEWLL